MKKKLYILFSLILFSISFQAQAYNFYAVNSDGDTIYYNIMSSFSPYTVSVTHKGSDLFSYSITYSDSINIPSSVNDNGITYSVIAIDIIAFRECTGLTSVTIPNSVTSIGDYAFESCTGLTSVTIPNSVTSIRDYAFESCTGLTSVTIPNSVTSIGNYAFESCTGLTSIPIPNSVTSIGINAFANCDGITAITIPNFITSISNGVFQNCTTLSSVSIPNSVTSIGENAFANCSSLSPLIIPNSVTSIGSTAFSGCTALNSVFIPYSVTSISYNAFQNCSTLSSINVDNNNLVYSSNDGILYNKNQDTLICCPNGKQGDLYIPNSVTLIGYRSLNNCRGLTSVSIPNSVTSIGDYAFQSCDSLTSIVIGNSIDTIGNYAFSHCIGLTSIILDDSLKTIGNNAFEFCSSLDTITIPYYVTTIQNTAFTACTSLSTLNFNAINCSIMNSPFNNCLSLRTVNIGNRVKVIPSNAFGYNSFDTVNMGDSVTTIVATAFWNCRNLSYINLPNSLISIGAFAFGNCSGLTSINIPNAVAYIGNSAFGGCSALNSIIIPNSITIINSSVFWNCSGLTSIIMGNNVTSIGAFAFSGCTNLDSIILPNTLESLGSGAFMYCRSLSSITLPYNITSILNNTFDNCRSLASITCKNNVPPVINNDYGAFFEVPRNIPVYVPCGSVSLYLSQYWGSFTNFIALTHCIYASDTNITINSVTLNASYSDTNITEKGFKWRKLGDTIFNTYIDTSSAFQYNINNLLPGTKYEYKAYCVFNNETYYSLIDTFKTENCVFAYCNNTTSTTSTLNATSIFPNFTVKGFQYRQLGTTTFNTYVDTSSAFQYTITNLIPFTKYEYRAYIEINNELTYSVIDTFMTLQCIFSSFSNTTSNTATLNAQSNITNFNSKGFQYRQLGTTTFNTYVDTSSVFQYTITNLIPFTKYEYKAYIEINSVFFYSAIDTLRTLCSDSALTLPFYEGFETNLYCWDDFRSSNDGFTIVNYSDDPWCIPHGGLNMLKYACWTIHAGNYAGYISPKINILPNSKLSLWIYRNNGQISYSNEGVRVLINSIQSEDNAIELGFISNNRLATPIINSDGWYNYIVDIPSSQIGEKFITLKAESQFGYNIYIDDLSIYSTPTVTTNINASICQGEIYLLNGFNVDSAGTYIQNLNTIEGVDSIVTLNLSLYPTVDTTHFTASICQGETYLLNGFNADSAGTYIQNLQTINGCDSIITLTLSVNELMIPTNLALDNIANYIELTWRGNGENYIIYRNNDSIANITDTIYQDTNVVDGTNYCYKIKALNSNCESELSQEVCQVFSGLKYIENNNLSVVTLYPNPTNDKATLEIEGLTKDAKVIVYDINGREIKQYNLNAGQKKLEIDVNGLANGVYNVRIVNDNISLTRKLIVR